MSFGKALYFPYIHFQDENWLKYSLLYWDCIKRIVPPSYITEDSPTVRTLIDNGLIESVDPQSGNTPYCVGAAGEFIPTIEELIKKGGVNPSIGKNVSENISKNATDALVHVQKMDGRVINMLDASGLGAKVGDWFSMESSLAGYYMLCLAGYISEKQNTPLLSDSIEMETAGTFFQHSRISENEHTINDVEFKLFKAVLPVPRPNNLDNVPIDKFVKFHLKHGDERTKFRNALSTFVKDAGDISDPTAQMDFINEKQKSIKSSLKDQRRLMDEFKVGIVDSLMSVAVPSTITGIAAPLNPASFAIAGGVGLAIALISWFAKARSEKRAAIHDCDWHYLLSVEKNFNTKTIADNSNTWMNQFLED